MEGREIPYLCGKQRRLLCRAARKPITFPTTLPRFLVKASINIFVGNTAIFLASLKWCLFWYNATGYDISVVPYNHTASFSEEKQEGKGCIRAEENVFRTDKNKSPFSKPHLFRLPFFSLHSWFAQLFKCDSNVIYTKWSE